MNTNRRYVLAERPRLEPDERTFRRDDAPMRAPEEGEVIVRNVYIPVDPGMRPVLSDIPIGADGFEPYPLGALVGYMTVGQVIESRDPTLSRGDWVTGILLWQDYATVKGTSVQKISVDRVTPATWLGLLGIPGLSAWCGLVALAAPAPGETVLVTSAAGAVGCIAGQIARNMGCHVIGVAGGPDKCRYLTEQLGFDASVDYRATDDLGGAVRAICPQGIDVLFDNVGNASVDSILPVMRQNGRITICGQIADYHLPPAQRPGIRNTNRFVTHRLTMRGLFVYDHASLFPRAYAELEAWIHTGKLKLQETFLDGFDQLPKAFARLFTGQPVGRTLVRIDRD